MSGPRFIPLPLGPQPAIGLEILAVIGGAAQIRTHYRVRLTCCGEETTLAHHSVISRRYNQVTQCPTCVKFTVAKRQRAQWAAARDQARRAGLRGAGRSLVETAWPRPPSLAGQPPGVWGAQ